MLTTQLIHGNSIEKLKELENESVDAIVSDPPYELGFMGKKWDNSGIAYNVDLWREALRVLKPGGHLLAFGGTRTYHRMAVAIEDAGFEVRDMLEWIYASGFPKSLNIGKAVDKLQGNEREVVGIDKNAERFKQYKEQDGCERKTFNDKITKGTSEWEGFGTALKPAHEPIIMARKPLQEKTIVEQVLKTGTGAIDIDGCRIPTSEENQPIRTRKAGSEFGQNSNWNDHKNIDTTYDPNQGRFPANIICTDDALNDGVITKSTSGKKNPNGKYHGVNSEVYGEWKPQPDKIQGIDDSGSKSRYFDIDVWGEKHGLLQFPKASKKERSEGCEELDDKIGGCLDGNADMNNNRKIGARPDQKVEPTKNNHPTVKPVHLMSWLVRLVSKEGDTVLDPFMGSGTTGVACKKLNRNFIGIELNEEYIKIAEARINAEGFSEKP